VSFEPKGWSYQGLGNTLGYLRRFDEANDAYKKAVELEPADSYYWSSWAWGLMQTQNLDESISKCKKAISIDSNNFDAWGYWGLNLEQQGKLSDALLKYKKAVNINPSYQLGRERIKYIEALKPASDSQQGLKNGCGVRSGH